MKDISTETQTSQCNIHLMSLTV